MRSVCVVTGTRANYGRLKTVMNAIEKSNELELKLIVTGMHLVPECGYTINEIRKDGYKIDEIVDMNLSNNSASGMCKSLGLGLIGMTQAIERIKPDIILILGDRDEDLAPAIIGAHMNIPVAHIHGGEVTGSIDESIRHAITKFSHIHFTANEDSKERVIKLGEQSKYVFNVGSPGLDSILNIEYKSKDELFNEYKLDINKRSILLAQHPVTTESSNAAIQIRETMEAIKKLNMQTVLIYPNSDAGSSEMIRVIEEYKNFDFIKMYKNIPFEDYLALLKYSDVMVGNSSSGIMEAPSFKLPVINIGTRQNGRLQSLNIINCDYSTNEIIEKIEYVLNDSLFKEKLDKCINLYGDGKTGEKIAEVLSNIKIDKNLIQKKITY
ncbi:MAG: UDP-N-acetylglucosamine 2-epimerase (hydrolyzing) [Clostridium sp.]|uniref:UDP-N-acetylglucosamine 2-epimerase n=1 Tax=Clostridium sp. DSM 8431 TaxID=1761781 RepID=UPI0008E7B4BA|nr:UDP-N-acetylglucosamine 2-epimerase [Clostridium sp. DSM 8431]MCR4943545.1 UDP-N-acetylglucosamine 2-epimerase (hydrolyzing) [Clostridium sp.]SFU65829.1 GDP/UDP-N,N'-diacetylbacillosamine 2-epimerase (hydrolysing) [Clostridium sp. DSM 8431]